MITDTLFDTGDIKDNPLNEFSGCHEGIIKNFYQLRALVWMVKKLPHDPSIKETAKDLLVFFEEVVLEHHCEEEQELFTAVMNCVDQGKEVDLARLYIKRLVAEHRELEGMWKQIEPDIEKLSEGKPANLDLDLAERLATRYQAHATFEEQSFLPLSAKILSKDEMSALGVALHMRHEERYFRT